MFLDFYKGRRVLLTGHTGFKGTWMSKVLLMQGARVAGYALDPPTDPSLFGRLGMESKMRSIRGDVRDREALCRAFDEWEPEVVIHLAAQPIVREGYASPAYTYETNVMGTVNLMEAVRSHPCVRSVINVTTDKVYRSMEWEWGYRETDEMDGYDPYSNSKSCSELVTACYKRSFFGGRDLAISTCRAGNVIGGGDFAKDRILPDCFRAAAAGREIGVRNPHSIRPYQHVLEPVMAYLMLAALQCGNAGRYEGSYNIGPGDGDCVTTGELVDMFCRAWNAGAADVAKNPAKGGDLPQDEKITQDERLPQGGFHHASWRDASEPLAPHEAGFLRLDCSKIRAVTGWRPAWTIKRAIEETVAFDRAYLCGGDLDAEMEREIGCYLDDMAS